MATTDPKRAALVRALMERDLYEMLEIPRDADEAQVRAAIARRTEWVEETPMRAAARDAEMHWLAWSERVLIDEPEIRADYDAALDAKAAAADRAVEARKRVRQLRVARDQLAKREAQRVVPQEAPKPAKKTTTRKKKADAAPAPAAADVEAITSAEDALRALEAADGNATAGLAFAARAVELDPSAEVLTRAGAALRGLGEPGRAAELLRQAIAADPHRSDARISLIYALRDAGDLPGAEAAGRAAVEEVPANGGVQYAFGRVLLAMDLLEEAETVLEAAQQNGKPEAAEALRELREAYAADGDADAVERVEEISYPEASEPATNDPAVAEPGIAPNMEAEPAAPADEPAADVTDEA